jgi:hypothetical protein
MFGLNKTINTKADAEAVFKKAINAAIDEARAAGVAGIIGILERRAAQLKPEWRPALSPKVFDSYGKPIDLAAKVDEARRERQRRIDSKCEIAPAMRQRAASGYRVR